MVQSAVNWTHLVRQQEVIYATPQPRQFLRFLSLIVHLSTGSMRCPQSFLGALNETILLAGPAVLRMA
jgi:hypothetical protein